MVGKRVEAGARQQLVTGLLERMLVKDVFDETCIVNQALVLLADKWALLVLIVLMQGTKRYSELQRQIRGVSPKMLTQTLRSLEQNELVTRQIFPEVPPRVEYTLTDFGKSLSHPLAALCDWAFEQEPRLRTVYRKAHPEP
ncbi:helix-turn-helix domain-containing protein [Stigmatella sp. ncwal1]|uniref:Helix-turn-helix domain-containing protein n=1 Tax=Stigmatella ashevillensis TaxID=2995309 RepID=A0ABT5DEK8_9BACT|nr:helix-turn-helix domain-containing protein [Stigmatella ashevillena]MDC0712091.1 helix-turn-helix domain-containing protein [Stigmatella ashevillena]